MKTKDMDKRLFTRGVVQIPKKLGGTIKSFGYNKPSCNLKLTQEAAVRVAMGMIKDQDEELCNLKHPHLGAPL